MLGTLTLVNPSLAEALARAVFKKNEIEPNGPVDGVISAGVAVGGFIVGKAVRGTVGNVIDKAFDTLGEWFGYEQLSKKSLGGKISIGDLGSSVALIGMARFAGFYMPDNVRPGFEGGAAAAALHTVVAPFLPKTLQGQYEPKAVGASYPTKATVGANGDNNYAKDDHRNNSAYNVAVGDPVGASYIIHPDYY